MSKADCSYKLMVMVEINENITFKQKFEEGIGITRELFYLGEENLWQKKIMGFQRSFTRNMPIRLKKGEEGQCRQNAM